MSKHNGLSYFSKWPVRPHPDEPGCLRDQLAAILVYLENAWQESDRQKRWQMARRVAIHHARRRPL